jgi:hypothetical protein
VKNIWQNSNSFLFSSGRPTGNITPFTLQVFQKLYFGIRARALFLSFLGSLPIGLITLTITQKTIQNGRHSGLMIALGATIMEFVYAFIALLSLDLFTQNTSTRNYIKIFATAIFLALGFYFLWKK